MVTTYAESLPVIIPAYNEARYIDEVLRSLPRSGTEPIVVVNGSTDRTSEIAREYGANVIELQEQGKLPAIQIALKALGENALNPLVILDGDTKPLFRNHWRNGFLKLLTKDFDQLPVAVGGPIIFSNTDIVDKGLKSVRRLHRAYSSQNWDGTKRAGQSGPQLGLNLKNKQTLNRLLALPHIWPGEDIAIVDVVLKSDGHFYQPLSLGMFATTPTSSTYVSEFKRRRIGIDETRKIVQQKYISDGSSNAISYSTYRKMKQE